MSVGRPSLPARKADRLTWLSAIWLFACLLLGGASNAGILANAALTAAAIVITASQFWQPGRGVRPIERLPLFAMIVVIGWGLLTLLPLPPAVWTALPARAELIDGYRLLGMELPWLPISLTDERTVRSMLALAVPFATYLIARDLTPAQIARLVWLLCGFAIVSVMLGLIQYLGGFDSPMRPYQITNRTVAVGFFANANHFATLLLVAIALSAAMQISKQRRRQSRRQTQMSRMSIGGVLAALVSVLALIGLVLAGSSAGLLLAVPALAIGWSIRRNKEQGLSRRGLLIVGGAAFAGMALAAALLAAGRVDDKLGTSAASRTAVTGNTLSAAADYMPTGSGLGSFAPVYLAKSGGQGTAREWMNHAHNDLAEVLLEFGLPGLVAIVIFLFWLTRATWMLWRDDSRSESGDLARAASLALWLMLTHSLVDYPLRTAAMAALFGLCVALVANAFVPREPDPAQGQ